VDTRPPKMRPPRLALSGRPPWGPFGREVPLPVTVWRALCDRQEQRRDEGRTKISANTELNTTDNLATYLSCRQDDGTPKLCRPRRPNPVGDTIRKRVSASRFAATKSINRGSACDQLARTAGPRSPSRKCSVVGRAPEGAAIRPGRAPAPRSGATGSASERGSVRTSGPRGGRT
jgi:hypothetical protein